MTRLSAYAISDEQGARKKNRSGQPAMNRSKQGGMAIKTIIVLLVGLALGSVRLAEGPEETSQGSQASVRN
jgi:hypothetical protein